MNDQAVRHPVLWALLIVAIFVVIRIVGTGAGIAFL